jgi:hypothetical protein
MTKKISWNCTRKTQISKIKFFEILKKKSVLKYQKIAQKFQDVFVKVRYNLLEKKTQWTFDLVKGIGIFELTFSQWAWILQIKSIDPMSTAEELTMEMVKKIGLLEAKYYGIFHVDMNGGLPCTSFEDLKISRVPRNWLSMFFFAIWKEKFD